MDRSELVKKATIVYTTVDNLDKAKHLAHEAIIEGYAACANVIPNGISVYRWEDKICEEQECFIIFKTLPSMANILCEWVVQRHPYATCAVLRMDADTSEGFYKYMDSALRLVTTGS